MVTLWQLMTIATEAQEIASEKGVVTISAGVGGARVHITEEAFDAFFPFTVNERSVVGHDGEDWTLRSIRLDGVEFQCYRHNKKEETDAESV